MASTSRTQHQDHVPSVQEQLTEVQRLLLRMRSDCEEYVERDREREEEKESVRVEKEAIWERLRRDVAQMADERREEAQERRTREEEILHILQEQHRQRMDAVFSAAKENKEKRKDQKDGFFRELLEVASRHVQRRRVRHDST